MNIDFDKINESITQNHYGGRKRSIMKRYADELENRIIFGRLEPGASIGLHTHENGSEFIFVLQGRGTALYDYGQEELIPGICHCCPKGHSHSLMNDGSNDLLFFAVVAKQ